MGVVDGPWESQCSGVQKADDLRLHAIQWRVLRWLERKYMQSVKRLCHQEEMVRW